MGERILVVDDNVQSRKLAQVVFEEEGFDVRAAGTAEEARATIESFAPALVVMDVQLPGTDGLTLTRELRADPKHAALRIVVLTSYAMPGDREKALAAGCDAYMTKPIDVVALVDLVTSLLR